MNPPLRPSTAVDAPSDPSRFGPPPGLVLTGGGFDQGVRWLLGERLEDLFEERCTEAPDGLAVDAPGMRLTFAELDARANQLARHLLDAGMGNGERVALVFDDAARAYVVMLAVLKAGAAYVPLDPGFPADRMAYIVEDAGVGAVLSLSHLRNLLGEIGVPVMCVDTAPGIEARDSGPVTVAERGPVTDPLAYVIYTSGSTGRPKGVAVEHGSICNFVRVAADVYGIRPGDRMYQGMTIAFDFSVEEIWVPWTAGATLVPRPPGSALLGVDLHAYLVAQRVTAMCCVPTLLATLEEDLPMLRFLLVSGEACPHDLIVRWHRSGRRFLNVYGPTEATVTATWTVVDPDRAVTIGVPLPTYSTVVLDPEDPTRALRHGEIGEIGIAGIGLAVGYVNRPDLTGKAFVRDFLGIPRNPSARIYRTGDLGRVNDDGEIEYHGRIDLQVKIRGYRIELTEIESVLLQVPGVAAAVVDTYEPVPGTVELVGYYSLRTDRADLDPRTIRAVLRDRLPSYMVPAYLEHLDAIPMTTQGKADRKNLPTPTVRVGATATEHVAPSTRNEVLIAAALTATLGLDRVSVHSHFFDDLGADSLVLARFSARLRKDSALPPLSMKDMYLHPTVSQLGALVGDEAAPSAGRPVEDVVRTPTPRYVLCGAAQVLLFLVHTCLMAFILVVGLQWLYSADGVGGIWRRAVLLSVAGFFALSALPIVVKWLSIGRWTVQEFPLWGVRYLRFWFVKLLLRANPMVFFAGSPLYNVYLRALGARIGKGAVVLTRNLPVCTDLVTIGAGTIVRKDSFFNGYRAQAGRIRTGTVHIGGDAVVCENTVIDIDAGMGDRAQLGHSSTLQSGQSVPEGETWHGNPARRCEVDYLRVSPARCGQLRRFGYATLQLVNVLVLYVPLGLVLLVKFLPRLPLLPRLMQPGETAIGEVTFYGEVLLYVFVLFPAGLVLGLLFIATVPRLLRPAIRPDTVYPLYGIRFWVHRVIAGLTNSRFYTYLFGDSSAILHYLRLIGYAFGRPVEQSGSNFGVEVKHESPFLSVVGSGTMVSDGLSLMNAEFSSTSFVVRRTVLAERGFLGNNVAFPAASRVGRNCLLATKVLIPIDGRMREDVGLLGAPPFEIPRSVQRDSAVPDLTGDERRRRLRAKNRHNAVTAGIFLLVLLIDVYVLSLVALLSFDYYFHFGWPVVAVGAVAALVFTIAFHVVVERATTSFRALSPQFCSIYDPYFWWHERFWKMSAATYLGMFNGTPMKNLLWRALGVRVGHKVFDDGCAMPEKSLVTVGAEAILNAGSIVQAHSLEDGLFKSDRVTIGPSATIGPRAFVHYGTTVHEGAVLDADSFLMKGEEVARFERWRGNPAAARRRPHAEQGRTA